MVDIARRLEPNAVISASDSVRSRSLMAWLERLLFVVLVVAGCAGAATIRGVPSCAYWMQDREPGGRSSYFNAMWLVGYLSGAAVHSEEDILRNADSEWIAAWMDNYCKANPSKNVAEGGEKLFDDLIRSVPIDKPSAALAAPARTAPHRASPPSAAMTPTTAAIPTVAPGTPEAPNAASAAPARMTSDAPNVASAAPARMTSEAPNATSAAPARMTSEAPNAASAAPARMTADAPVGEPSTPNVPVPTTVKAALEAPPEASAPPRAESPTDPHTGPSYLPRALVLRNTLPLSLSKYQFKAEQYAKANGCVGAAATINIRTATSETFTLSCSNGAALSVRCDPNCRDLQ